jgi:hypothetical protein
MEKLTLTAALLIVLPMVASAQNADSKYRGEAYVFLGVGSGTATPRFEHVGGGGEALLFKGLGVGGELGAIGVPGTGAGVFSIGPSYHFVRSFHNQKIVPFAQGGYTRTFHGDAPFPVGLSNLFNFGGGIHYWIWRRVGMRLDFRDYVYHEPSGGRTDQYWGIRIGLAIR